MCAEPGPLFGGRALIGIALCEGDEETCRTWLPSVDGLRVSSSVQ